jgi:hypothetical protein
MVLDLFGYSGGKWLQHCCCIKVFWWAMVTTLLLYQSILVGKAHPTSYVLLSVRNVKKLRGKFNLVIIFS